MGQALACSIRASSTTREHVCEVPFCWAGCPMDLRHLFVFEGGLALPAAETGSSLRVGMVATARKRRGIVALVEPFDGDSGRLDVVRIEYEDDQLPLSEGLVRRRDRI